jgi:hypothetical protein
MQTIQNKNELSSADNTSSTNTINEIQKKSADINYNALNLINSAESLLQGRVHLKVFLVVVAIATFVGIIFESQPVIGAGFFVFIGFTIYVANLLPDRDRRLWKQFALDNGWRSEKVQHAGSVLPPTIAGRGHSRVLSDVVSGTYSGNRFKSFTYTYTEGHGRLAVIYTQTIIQIVLHKPLPSFLLDSSLAGVARDIPPNFIHVSLEGNFDSSFKLYAPKESTTDVLSVLSPDIMQALILNNTLQDIQSENGSIWFVQHGDTRRQPQLRALFIAIEGVMPEFYHRLKSYNATRVDAPAIVASLPLEIRTQSVAIPKTKNQIISLTFKVLFMLGIFTFLFILIRNIQNMQNFNNFLP